MSALKFKTLREKIVDEIRKKILNHELKQGERIKEQELAAEFHTSRGPIREALRQLENEGLIEYKRNAGCSVKNLTINDIFEIYLMRANYEIMGVKIIGGKFPEESFQRMEAALDHMKQTDVEHYDDIFQYDNEFHSEFVRGTHFPRLYKAWKELNYGNIPTGYTDFTDKQNTISRQYKIHKEIYDLCRTADVDEICKGISEHYMRTIRRLEKEQDLINLHLSWEFLL